MTARSSTRTLRDGTVPAGPVLVPGGAGYIGSHFVRRLERLGVPVIVLDDLSTGHRAAVRAHRLEQVPRVDHVLAVVLRRLRDALADVALGREVHDRHRAVLEHG